MSGIVERHFIWIISAFSTLALLEPTYFIWLKPYVTLLLGIILLGIGFSIDSSDVNSTFENRGIICFAILSRYFLMPVAAFFIGKFLQLPMMEFVGLIILGTCPGGTAANVMSYLSRGNIALTVILTFGTTLMAPIMMPTLIYVFLKKEIVVPFFEMANNIFLVVFIPLMLGLIIKKYFGNVAKHLARVFPVISIFAISLAIACIMSLSQQRILDFPLLIISAAFLFNITGYFLGFIISKTLNCKPAEQKSIFFEFGMFDAGLGIIIATHFFGPVAALPSAFISIIQNITASFLVKRFRTAT